jgi:hypothetical protein
MLAAGHRPPQPAWALLFSAACVTNKPDMVRFVWYDEIASTIITTMQHAQNTQDAHGRVCVRVWGANCAQGQDAGA